MEKPEVKLEFTKRKKQQNGHLENIKQNLKFKEFYTRGLAQTGKNLLIISHNIKNNEQITKKLNHIPETTSNNIKCKSYVQSIIIIVGFTKISRLNMFQQDLYSIGDRIICRQLLEKVKRG